MEVVSLRRTLGADTGSFRMQRPFYVGSVRGLTYLSLLVTIRLGTGHKGSRGAVVMASVVVRRDVQDGIPVVGSPAGRSTRHG
jgi:hypothetical protein